MLRLLFGIALLVALAAGIALVPLRGRTVLDRWSASHGAREFFERGYQEAKVAMGLDAQKPRPGRAQPSHPAKPLARRARPPTPTERHTDEDRAELDRIVAEHAR